MIPSDRNIKETQELLKQLNLVVTEEEQFYKIAQDPLGNLELINQLITMEVKKAEVKKFYEDYGKLQEKLEETFGIGFNFQDQNTGIVYLTERPEWKNIRMEHFGIARTRSAEEIEAKGKGSLSITKAQELGYTVEGKAPKNK